MSEQVVVSVIMGIYKEKDKRMLEQAIRSILQQTLKELELIVFLDGIDAQTWQTLRRLSNEDSRVRIMGEYENHGLAYALNKCIGYANGEYIARMDADDIATEDRLEKQIAYLKEHEECDFVGCAVELLGDDGVWGYRQMPPIPTKKDYLPFSPYIHPTVVFRKAVLDECNGYRFEDSTVRCEDYDLFMRLHMMGKTGHNMADRLLYYRENLRAYKKRKYQYRIVECRLRYHLFKEMGLWNIKGMLYILKPLIVGLIPSKFMMVIQQQKIRWLKNEAEETIAAVQGDTQPEAGVIAGFRRAV